MRTVGRFSSGGRSVPPRALHCVDGAGHRVFVPFCGVYRTHGRPAPAWTSVTSGIVTSAATGAARTSRRKPATAFGASTRAQEHDPGHASRRITACTGARSASGWCTRERIFGAPLGAFQPQLPPPVIATGGRYHLFALPAVSLPRPGQLLEPRTAWCELIRRCALATAATQSIAMPRGIEETVMSGSGNAGSWLRSPSSRERAIADAIASAIGSMRKPREVVRTSCPVSSCSRSTGRSSGRARAVGYSPPACSTRATGASRAAGVSVTEVSSAAVDAADLAHVLGHSRAASLVRWSRTRRAAAVVRRAGVDLAARRAVARVARRARARRAGGDSVQVACGHT